MQKKELCKKHRTRNVANVEENTVKSTLFSSKYMQGHGELNTPRSLSSATFSYPYFYMAGIGYAFWSSTFHIVASLPGENIQQTWCLIY